MKCVPNIDVRISQQYYFFFAASSLFFLSRKGFRNIIFFYLSGILFFTNFTFSLYIPFFQWALITMGMILISVLIEKEIDKKLIINILSLICILQSIWIIFEYYNIDLSDYIMNYFSNYPVKKMQRTPNGLIPFDGNLRIAGSLGQQTHSGVLLIFLITLFRKKWFIFLPLPIIAIIITESANVLVSALVVMFIYIFMVCNRKIVSFFSMFFLTTCLLINYFKSEFFYSGFRYIAWERILKWAGHTFFGKGPSFLYLHPTVENAAGQLFRHAHNEIIDSYILWGYSGLICLVILLVHFFIKSEKDKYLFPIFLGLLFNSLFNLTFHISTLALIAIIIYSILTGEKKWENLKK